jgi:hypothetical protein
MPDHGAELKQLIARVPDFTLAEMKGRLEQDCPVTAIHWVVGRLPVLTFHSGVRRLSGDLPRPQRHNASPATCAGSDDGFP